MDTIRQSKGEHGCTELVQEAQDLAHKPRIAPARSGIVDIGCYENQQQGLVIFVR